MHPYTKVLVLLCGVTLPIYAFADQEPHVTVQGICFRQISQDKGFAEFNLEFVEKDGKAAAAKVETQQKDLKRRIEALTLKDVEFETLSFNVMPQYEYSNNASKLRGIRASLVMRVETSETSRVSDLAATGTNAGVKAVQSVGFFVSNRKLSEEKTACLEEAVVDARRRADRLAKAAGLKIKRAFNIVQSENARGQQGYEAFAKSASMDAGGANAPQLDRKNQEINVEVTATFEAG